MYSVVVSDEPVAFLLAGNVSAALTRKGMTLSSTSIWLAHAIQLAGMLAVLGAADSSNASSPWQSNCVDCSQGPLVGLTGDNTLRRELSRDGLRLLKVDRSFVSTPFLTLTAWNESHWSLKMGLWHNILMIAFKVIEWRHLCAVFGSSARTSNKSSPLLALLTFLINLSLDIDSASSSSTSSSEEATTCSSLIIIVKLRCTSLKSAGISTIECQCWVEIIIVITPTTVHQSNSSTNLTQSKVICKKK